MVSNSFGPETNIAVMTGTRIATDKLDIVAIDCLCDEHACFGWWYIDLTPYQ